MRFAFCPRDGARLEARLIDGRMRPACPRCGFADFMHVQIGANTVVERDGAVLLVRLSYGPREGYWALPGGLVEADETLEQAARRETSEETGFEVALDGLLATWMRRGSAARRHLPRAHPARQLRVPAAEATEGAGSPDRSADPGPRLAVTSTGSTPGRRTNPRPDAPPAADRPAPRRRRPERRRRARAPAAAHAG